MNREQILDLMNTYSLMYPSSFKNLEDQRRRDKYFEIWNSSLALFDFQDVKEGMQWLFENHEGNYAPNMKTLIGATKIARSKRLNLSGKGGERIQTCEEVIYKEIWKPTMDKLKKTEKDWETLERFKKYAELFSGDGWEERYKAYFGKYKKEYEKL